MTLLKFFFVSLASTNDVSKGDWKKIFWLFPFVALAASNTWLHHLRWVVKLWRVAVGFERQKRHQRLRRLNHALVDLIKKHLMTLPKWRLLSHGRDCRSRRQQDDIITSLEWRCDVIITTSGRQQDDVTTSTGRRYDVKAPSRQQWAVFMTS